MCVPRLAQPAVSVRAPPHCCPSVHVTHLSAAARLFSPQYLQQKLKQSSQIVESEQRVIVIGMTTKRGSHNGPGATRDKLGREGQFCNPAPRFPTQIPWCYFCPVTSRCPQRLLMQMHFGCRSLLGQGHPCHVPQFRGEGGFCE